MARGTANNEGVSSVQQSVDAKTYGDNFERTFGKRDETRGRWVMDPKTGKLVRPWEYEGDSTSRAIDASVLSGRFYENTVATDGTDIGSRAKHRAYMRERGLTTADDYDSKGGAWDKAEARRALGFMTPEQRKDRQERVDRELHRVENLPQAKYDREVAERARKRRERGPGVPTE